MKKTTDMEMEKQMFAKQMFEGQAETMGHREEFEHTKFARLLPSPWHLVHIIDYQWSCLFLEQVLHLHSFRQFGARSRGSSRSFVADCFQLKIIQIPRRYFGVGQFCSRALIGYKHLTIELLYR